MSRAPQIAVALALAAIAGCDDKDVYLGSDVQPHTSSSGGHGGAAGSGGESGATGGGSGGSITIADAGTGHPMGSGGRMNTGSGGTTVMPVQDSGAGGTGAGGTGGMVMMTADAGGTPPGCPTGFDDCDGRADNGCETNTDSDDNHCGDCDTACPPFGVMSFGSNCTAGKCVLICEGVFADCDDNPSTGCESVGPCP